MFPVNVTASCSCAVVANVPEVGSVTDVAPVVVSVNACAPLLVSVDEPLVNVKVFVPVETVSPLYVFPVSVAGMSALTNALNVGALSPPAVGPASIAFAD